MTIDGQAGHYIESNNKGQTWINLSGDRYVFDSGSSFDKLTSWATGEQALPIAAKNVSVPVRVTAAIKPLSKLPGSEELKLDGQATLTLVYL